MISLRPDQTDVLNETGFALKEHQSVLVQAETGWGKTVFAARMALGAQAKGRRVIFGVHRKELAIQTAKTFDKFGIRYGFIAAGMGYDPFATVHIASVDTLRTRRNQLKGDLLVPDEAHLWAADTRAEMIAEFRAQGGKVVGLSATPERLDGRSLRPLFDHMVCGPPTQWLMDQGHLNTYRAFAPVRPDFAKLHTRGGDFVTSELEDEFDKPSIIGDAIKVYRKYADGLRCIVFAFSRRHGMHLCEAYRANGIPAVYIDGTTPDRERREAVLLFAEQGGMLVQVELAIEGWDLSAQIGRHVPVQAVSLQRPSKSLPRAKQMMGRALRWWEKPSIMMDHVNLFWTHGLPEKERAWSLDGREAREKAEGVEAAIPMVRCGVCFYAAKSFTICPSCKTPVPVSEGRQVKAVDGELEEIDREAVKRAQYWDGRRAQAAAQDLPTLAKLAVSQGKQAGWVVHLMKARGKTVRYDEVERAMRGARG